jgi:hypothetical protein
MNKTSEAQLRAIAKYRSKNKEKIRELTRLYSRKYYSNPVNYENHKEKQKQIYHQNKLLF